MPVVEERDELTPKQRAFVREYLVDLNGSAAAIRAGYAKSGASVEGSRLLANAKVQKALTAAQAARAERLDITADMVLRQWWSIATADPNGVVQHRRICCEKCYGEEPFDLTKSPVPTCSECRGEGVSNVFIEDTRKLRGDAKILYAGVKQSAQGIEVKMRDQDKALELVARHLGMFKDEINLGGNVVINVMKRG